MQHGRSHESREARQRLTRRGNTPEPDALEPRMLLSGRHHAQPNEGLIGAHTERRLPRSLREDQLPEVEGDEPIGAGANVLPGSPRDRTLMNARHERQRAAAAALEKVEQEHEASASPREVEIDFQPESGQPGDERDAVAEDERDPRDDI